MNLRRLLKRNKLRKKVGNRNLRKVWIKERIKEIGIIPYMVEYNRTTKSHKTIGELYL